MATQITVEGLTQIFKDKIAELQEEPAWQISVERIKYATDENGEPLVKLAIGNVPLEYDLWQGLRNPALVGLFPVGLPEIWDFYANKKKGRTDEHGKPTIFQVPCLFDFAQKNYHRAVIISVMLPYSPKIIEDYTQRTQRKGGGYSHLFLTMNKGLEDMVDIATSRVAIGLVTDDNAVVAITNATARKISEATIPQTHLGASHGPLKYVNYSQRSIAALIGLGQFGVSRYIFRDELANGKVQRFSGSLASIIMFDKQELVRNGSNGIIYPSEAWREFLFKLFDFTNIDPEVNKYRFCSYIPYDDEGCAKCIGACSSGALANSTPSRSGKYPDRILRQIHRFWEGKLQFDFAQCAAEEHDPTELFPEWGCGKCGTICVYAGKRKIEGAQNFYEKMRELAK